MERGGSMLFFSCTFLLGFWGVSFLLFAFRVSLCVGGSDLFEMAISAFYGLLLLVFLLVEVAVGCCVLEMVWNSTGLAIRFSSSSVLFLSAGPLFLSLYIVT